MSKKLSLVCAPFGAKGGRFEQRLIRQCGQRLPGNQPERITVVRESENLFIRICYLEFSLRRVQLNRMLDVVPSQCARQTAHSVAYQYPNTLLEHRQ